MQNKKATFLNAFMLGFATIIFIFILMVFECLYILKREKRKKLNVTLDKLLDVTLQAIFTRGILLQKFGET